MKRTTLLTSVAMSALFGCVPGLQQVDPPVDSGQVGNQTPRERFDSSVAPMLSACSGCHVGPETSTTDMFLGQTSSNDSFYAGITKDRRVNGNFDPASAELLTKGAHHGVTWWTSAQTETISGWLVAESDARGSGSDIVNIGSGSDGGSGGPTGTTDPQIAETQWASCLAKSLAAYQSTKVYAIADMQSSQGACYSCHEPGGAGGAYWGIDNDYQTMLAKWQMAVFITGPFEVGAIATTPATYKMISGRSKICNKGTEQQRNGGTHPTFTCTEQTDGVNPMDALDAFTAAVQANEDSGLCPAPGAFAPPG